MMQQTFIGVDVAKDWLEIHHPEQKPRRIENTPKATKTFARLCVKEGAWIIFETSGKDTKAHRYINEARMINAALTGAFQGINRATLNRAEFDLLIRLEHENEFLLHQERP